MAVPTHLDFRKRPAVCWISGGEYFDSQAAAFIETQAYNHVTTKKKKKRRSRHKEGRLGRDERTVLRVDECERGWVGFEIGDGEGAGKMLVALGSLALGRLFTLQPKTWTWHSRYWLNCCLGN